MKAVISTRSYRKTNKLMQFDGEKYVLSFLKRTEIARPKCPIAWNPLMKKKIGKREVCSQAT
jgi:hypothetical protein